MTANANGKMLKVSGVTTALVDVIPQSFFYHIMSLTQINSYKIIVTISVQVSLS